MPVVEIDRSKPFTRETGFAILSIIGIAPEVLRELILPEDYAKFLEWENKNTMQITTITPASM